MLAGNTGDDTVYKTNVLISGSSAIQANGGFFGNLIGNANTATSASHALQADSALTANTSTTAGFASVAATASYVEYTDVANKPTLVSGSGQIDVSLTTGNISGARVSGPVSDSVNAVTASYALTSEPQVSASYASLAENLTVGAKTHDGVFQQTVPIPALFNETDFYTVTGANAGVYHIGLQDYTGFGVKFAHQGYMSEQFDSFGFNYGTAIGNSLTGVGFFMITSGSGEQVGLLTEQVPGQSKTTTDLSGHTTTLRGIDNLQLSGSVFSQNDITAPNFIGNLQGNANTATTSVSSSYSTVAENLTSGDKTHAGSIKQTFNAPTTDTQVDLLQINGATGGNANVPYNNFTVAIQDYPGFGNTYKDSFLVEKYDSFGYNYGAELAVAGAVFRGAVGGRNGGSGQVTIQDQDNGIVQTIVRGNQLINFANGAGGYTDQFYDHPTSGRNAQVVLREFLADNTQSEVAINGDNIGIGTDNTNVGGNGAITIGNTSTTNSITVNGLGDYADDATAAANGVPLNGLYRTGNVIKI